MQQQKRERGREVNERCSKRERSSVKMERERERKRKWEGKARNNRERGFWFVIRLGERERARESPNCRIMSGPFFFFWFHVSCLASESHARSLTFFFFWEEKPRRACCRKVLAALMSFVTQWTLTYPTQLWVISWHGVGELREQLEF